MIEGFTPQWLGFEFRNDGVPAMIVDERDDEFLIQTGETVRCILQAEFFEWLGKDEQGYYID